MITRSKFYVSNSENLNHQINGKDMVVISLSTVYSPEQGTENNCFWDASPNGSAALYVPLEDSHELPLGSYHYVDMEPDALRTCDLPDSENNFEQTLFEQGQADNNGNRYSVRFKVQRGHDSITICVTNKVVWPYFTNRVGQKVRVTFTRTTKSGQQLPE